MTEGESTKKSFRDLLSGPEKPLTPLFTIGLILAFLEIVLVIGVIGTDGRVQEMLALSIPASVILVIVGFFALLWARPFNLYGPKEVNETNDPKALAEAYAISKSVSGASSLSKAKSIEIQSNADQASIEVSEVIEEILELGPSDESGEETKGEERSWILILISELNADIMDFGKAEEALTHIREEETDNVRFAEVEAAYLLARYRHGDTQALNVIQKLAKESDEPGVSAAFHFTIGTAHQTTGTHRQAIEEFQKAIDIYQNRDRRARSIAQMSLSYSRLNNTEHAKRIIIEALSTETDRDAFVVLYRALASRFDEGKEILLKAVMLEKAADLKPEDIDLRFDAALSYSNAGFHAISLYHYGIISNLNPQSVGAFNNSGVEYSHLQMPAKSIESYKKSFALGNTLAGANIAQNFIAKGFTEEAQEVLDRASAMDEVHQNVNQARFDIAKSQEREEALADDAMKEARLQKQFFLEYASAAITVETMVFPFEGNWLSDDGRRIPLVQEGNTIKAEWVEDKRKYSFKGIADGKIAKIEEFESTYDSIYAYVSPETYLSEGLAYVSPDGKRISIVGRKLGELVTMSMQKLP